MPRTFIALPLRQETQDAAVDLVGKIATVAESVKWVEPENLHLTMKFLDEVPQLETYNVCRAVQQVASQFEPFPIQYYGAGAFPKIEKPRAMWIGVREGRDELIAMQAKLDDVLADLGYRREPRQFEPHLTIGRIGTPGRWIPACSQMLIDNADYDAGVDTVNEMIVYASELTSQGPHYTVLGRGKLGEST